MKSIEGDGQLAQLSITHGNDALLAIVRDIALAQSNELAANVEGCREGGKVASPSSGNGPNVCCATYDSKR